MELLKLAAAFRHEERLLFEATVDDQIRHRERVVGRAVEVPVNLSDALVHALQEVAQGAETIFVLLAMLDASERNHSVVEHEADEALLFRRLSLRRIQGSGAGHDLTMQVGSEGRDRADSVCLDNEDRSTRNFVNKKTSH